MMGPAWRSVRDLDLPLVGGSAAIVFPTVKRGRLAAFRAAANLPP